MFCLRNLSVDRSSLKFVARKRRSIAEPRRSLGASAVPCSRPSRLRYQKRTETCVQSASRIRRTSSRQPKSLLLISCVLCNYIVWLAFLVSAAKENLIPGRRLLAQGCGRFSYLRLQKSQSRVWMNLELAGGPWRSSVRFQLETLES